MKRWIFWYTTGVLSLAVASVASAAPRVPLTTGMTFSQVRQTWGAPRDEEELESQRLVRWNYQGGQAIFNEGQLTTWSSEALKAPSPVPSPVATPEAGSAPVKFHAKVGTLKESQVQGLLEAVMKEGGDSETTIGGVPGVPGGGAIVPQPPTFLIPTPFGYSGGFPGKMGPP